MKNKNIIFIGAGNMAEALIGGIVKNRVFSPKHILACDINEDRLKFLKNEYNVSGFLSIDKLKKCFENIRKNDIIVLSVKPKDAEEVLDEIKEKVTKDNVVVSVMAGVTLKYLEQKLPYGTKIVRVMPNMPAMAGEGMSVLAFNDLINQQDRDIIKVIFESVGKVLELPESLFDTVTALSGSGPAYIFYLAEYMIKAGEYMGLSYEQSRFLTLQTIFGSAKIMKQHETLNPSVLRKKVTSPNGTTEAAIKYFEEKGLGDTILKAIEKAKERSEELKK